VPHGPLAAVRLERETMTALTSPVGGGVVSRKATKDDLPDLAQTLAEAFFTDPVFEWWIPDLDRRREILPGFFEVINEATISGDELYVTDDAVGGAVWLPPGGQPSEEDMAALAPLLEQATEEYAGPLFELLALMEEKHPQEPHYYLFILGTRPQWQSQGIGSALMKIVLERADREGTPAYLEATSEGSKRLYLRHGFEVTGELRLRDAPPLWPMWRTPNPG
jgi:GNAT superfamily N-acetyltransferase